LPDPEQNGNKPQARDSPPPYQLIVSAYHEALPMCPKVQKLTEARKASIRARWRQGELPDLATWKEFFAWVGESNFLTGRGPARDGRRPFVADLEWLCKERNFVRIWEGQYHDK
jgi:hypothetical protein